MNFNHTLLALNRHFTKNHTSISGRKGSFLEFFRVDVEVARLPDRLDLPALEELRPDVFPLASIAADARLVLLDDEVMLVLLVGLELCVSGF